MINMKLYLIHILFVILEAQKIPKCPIITLKETLEDRYVTELNIPTVESSNGVRIGVELDRKADVLITDFGETTSPNNQIFTIDRPDRKIFPGQTVKAKVTIKFSDSNWIPNIVKITLNGKDPCTEVSNVIDVRVQQPNNDKTTQSLGVKGCGTIPEAESLIFNGDLSSEGAWPWHVAIMRINPPRVIYNCGGSIISENFVLTAAHCVTFPRTKEKIGTQNILIYIGVTKLTSLDVPSVKILTAADIFIPDDYSSDTYFNDIALIKLSGNLQFTNFIRPICLWSEDIDQSTITGRKGTVVGWGVDHRNQSFSSDLRHAEIPVVSLETCRSQSDFYQRHTNEKTFCAGGEEGKAVCNGDSGGGMIFRKPGKSIWQIRGVVSLNKRQEPGAVCNTKGYAVFTDVARHLDWISQTANLK